MVNKAILLCGPTASGKTAIALQLAQKLPIEIISVDSALIYQDLNIGSAKPTASELAAAKHHLIDIRSPLDSYSVAEFVADCRELISAINLRGNLPLLVGGTMMYYNALIKGMAQLPGADSAVRAHLDQLQAVHGLAYLHKQLQQVDPHAAARIEVNDSQRLKRALEVWLISGQSLTALQATTGNAVLSECNYLPLAIVPTNRQLLHERINQRFNLMLEQGLIDEVNFVRTKYPELTDNHNSMRAVGYRQAWQYVAGELSWRELVEHGQAATRQLAKRQITWLRSMDIVAIDDLQLTVSALTSKIYAAIDKFVSDGTV